MKPDKMNPNLFGLDQGVALAVGGSPEVGPRFVKMGTSATIPQVEALMGKGYAVRITQLPNP